jgi:hypothetical protein
MTASVSAPATATTITVSAAARAFLTRPGDVNAQSAAAQIFAIQGVDGLLRCLRRIHRYKGEPTRAARGSVSNEIGLDDRAIGGEGVLQVVFRDFEVEVPDE